MSAPTIPHQFATWFTTGSSWTGPDGVLHHLAEHAVIAGESLAVGAVLALPAGVLLTRVRRGGAAVTSLANAARAIPILGVLFLLALSPLSLRAAVVIALTVFAMPPMLTNTFTGVREVDADVRAAAVGMGMSPAQVIRRVDLPLALPLIATGVRLAAVQVWATATLAAYAGEGGLGAIVKTGYATYDYGAIYGGVLVIVVTSLALDGVLAIGQRALARAYGQSPAAARPLRRRRASRSAPPSVAAGV